MVLAKNPTQTPNMITLRAYKTELRPNNVQRNLLHQHAGCARFAYNWGLTQKITQYEKTRKSPSAMELHKQLNRLKSTSFPWMYQVSKCAPQEALRDLDKAFKNFFRRLKTGEKPGFPRYKSRKRGIGSFRLTGTIRVHHDRIQLPRLGIIRLKERGYLPTGGGWLRMLSATVSEKAGRWFVSVQVEERITIPQNKGPRAGVDWGLETLLTVSDGVEFPNPRALSRYDRKLRRAQRSLSRKRRGSRNRAKTRHRLRRIHARITNIRKDTLHKASSWLARTKSATIIEDLHVKGLLKNKQLARVIADAGFGELWRQLTYKSRWYGSRLHFAPRFYPSSKRCSRCGHIKEEMPLSVRVFRCERCGLVLGRDLNAALNLLWLLVAASWAETLNAWLRREVATPQGVVPVHDAGTKHQPCPLGDKIG
ncbi:MAG: RNA-guided endonuclease InsQ/TnpB family protein [Promethearchaeota archaeon]